MNSMRASILLVAVLSVAILQKAAAIKPLVGNPAPEFKAVAVYQVRMRQWSM